MQRWANDDLRSLNAQVEYVLRDALKRAGRVVRPRADTPEADGLPGGHGGAPKETPGGDGA